MHQLVQIAYSPWSERARWALDHHGIVHRRVAYLPGIDEPALRWRLGQWRGRVSVPVLLPEGGPPVTDSEHIARWAEARGSGAPLFVDEAASARWHALSEQMLAAGRVLATRRTIADRAAMHDALPKFLKPTGPVGRLVGRMSAENLLRKYDPAVSDEAACLRVLEEGLTTVRAALADGDHLVGDSFTWADLTTAAGLTFVRPPERWPGLGPPGVEAWTCAPLAERFEDVLAWRDRVWASRAARGQRGLSAPPR